MAGRATEILPPGKTRRFQIRRNGVGIALRDGVDGADALERFYENWAARGGGQSLGPLVIEGGGTHYASGRVEVTLVRGTPSRASGTTFETRLEALAVAEQTPLPTWPEAVTFSTPTP